MSHNERLNLEVPISPNHAGPSLLRQAMARILVFVILLVVWIILSGRLDGFHLALGVFSCALVAGFSGDLLFANSIDDALPKLWLRFVAYIPWLLGQILKANLHVLYLAFHPRMMDLIDPHIIEFDSRLRSDVARTTFANSITLTPGTITVSVNAMGKFAVHCIDRPSGASLPGEMESRITEMFAE